MSGKRRIIASGHYDGDGCIFPGVLPSRHEYEVNDEHDEAHMVISPFHAKGAIWCQTCALAPATARPCLTHPKETR